MIGWAEIKPKIEEIRNQVTISPMDLHSFWAEDEDGTPVFVDRTHDVGMNFEVKSGGQIVGATIIVSRVTWKLAAADIREGALQQLAERILNMEAEAKR